MANVKSIVKAVGSLFKKKAKKTQTSTRANVGPKQTKSTPAGVSGKTKKVKSQEKRTTGKVRSEGKPALKAKAKRTKGALNKEQASRRKAGEGSAARTARQRKKDVKDPKNSSINQGAKGKKAGQGTRMNATQVKKAQEARRKKAAAANKSKRKSDIKGLIKNNTSGRKR